MVGPRQRGLLRKGRSLVRRLDVAIARSLETTTRQVAEILLLDRLFSIATSLFTIYCSNPKFFYCYPKFIVDDTRQFGFVHCSFLAASWILIGCFVTRYHECIKAYLHYATHSTLQICRSLCEHYVVPRQLLTEIYNCFA